jgi:hypothetical protein
VLDQPLRGADLATLRVAAGRRPARLELALHASKMTASGSARSGRARRVLSVQEIDWIEAADYYVQIHAGGKSDLHRESMNSLESRLDPERFLRIHRSAIVNRDRIKELRTQGRRDVVVVLAGGAELRVAEPPREALGAPLRDTRNPRTRGPDPRRPARRSLRVSPGPLPRGGRLLHRASAARRPLRTYAPRRYPHASTRSGRHSVPRLRGLR